MNLHKICKLLRSRSNHEKSEVTVYRKGEIFANYISDRVLMSSMYEDLRKLNTSLNPSMNVLITRQMNKWEFSKEHIEVANKHIK